MFTILVQSQLTFHKAKLMGQLVLEKLDLKLESPLLNNKCSNKPKLKPIGLALVIVMILMMSLSKFPLDQVQIRKIGKIMCNPLTMIGI